MIRVPIGERILAAYCRSGFRGFLKLWDLSGRARTDRFLVRSKYGTVFRLNPWSYIDERVLREGFYESEVLDAIVSALGQQGVLWDVGANLGLHGISAKRRVPGARVVCFEPQIEMVGLLGDHQRLNGTAIVIVPIALSDRSGFQTLRLGPPGNRGMSALAGTGEPASAEGYPVAVARGDDLVAAGVVPAPTVVKIDVEGHEVAVLEGMARLLASPGIQAVVFEDGMRPDTPAKAILVRAGFAIRSLRRNEKSDHPLGNFVATRG